jgi:hypothetical protein
MLIACLYSKAARTAIYIVCLLGIVPGLIFGLGLGQWNKYQVEWAKLQDEKDQRKEDQQRESLRQETEAKHKKEVEEAEAKQRTEALRSYAASVIKPSEVATDNVTVEEADGRMWLSGNMTNKSGYPLASVDMELSVFDCPSRLTLKAFGIVFQTKPDDLLSVDECSIVGQERASTAGGIVDTGTFIPSKQTRRFATKMMQFDNMPILSKPESRQLTQECAPTSWCGSRAEGIFYDLLVNEVGSNKSASRNLI